MTRILFFSGSMVACLFACSGNEETQVDLRNGSLPQYGDSMYVEGLNNALRPGDFSEPDVYVSSDTNQCFVILNDGTFHGDEVNEKDLGGVWYGIFADNGTYFMEETTVKTKRVNDAVLDAEGEATGWKITTAHPDDALILLKGKGLRNRDFEAIEFKKEVYPGDTIQFDFKGKNYWIFATGSTDDLDGRSVENYKLFMMTEKQGELISQLLVSHDNFDDAMCSVLFIGDIDSDGIPDLILDNSRHYNSDNPTLYLSGDAGENSLLRIVGWHYAVGC